MAKKKSNFFFKSILYIFILILILIVTTVFTKWYFYDSDYAVEKTDLSAVSIENIKLRMNINDIDTSKYTKIDDVVDGCNYNFEELSIKTSSKGEIEYIIADFKKINNLDIGQSEGFIIQKSDDIFEVLGDKCKTDIYKSEENNFRRISKYIDTDNDINFAIVYSRFNNEMLYVILSKDKIKD